MTAIKSTCAFKRISRIKPLNPEFLVHLLGLPCCLDHPLEADTLKRDHQKTALSPAELARSLKIHEGANQENWCQRCQCPTMFHYPTFLVQDKDRIASSRNLIHFALIPFHEVLTSLQFIHQSYITFALQLHHAFITEWKQSSKSMHSLHSERLACNLNWPRSIIT